MRRPRLCLDGHYKIPFYDTISLFIYDNIISSLSKKAKSTLKYIFLKKLGILTKCWCLYLLLEDSVVCASVYTTRIGLSFRQCFLQVILGRGPTIKNRDSTVFEHWVIVFLGHYTKYLSEQLNIFRIGKFHLKRGTCNDPSPSWYQVLLFSVSYDSPKYCSMMVC